MAISDWTDQKNGGNMVLSIDVVYEGLKALKMIPLISDDLIKTLDISVSDSPTAVNYTFWGYQPNPASITNIISVIFRYQNNDNFYAATLKGIGGATDNIGFSLGKMENGSWSATSDTPHIGNYLDQWVHWKITMCEISNVIYANLYRESGTWVLIRDKTLSPAKWISGGACGVGAAQAVNTGGLCYLDLTKIYY